MNEPEVDPRFRGNDEVKSIGGRPKPPRWTIAFLRALERTGLVRAAAADAGIDHTTAYARRRTHGAFAEAWDGALERFRAERGRMEEAAAVLDSTPPRAPLHRGEGRRGLLVPGLGGGQMKRAGEGRWSERKERVFFAELAATANVRRSAEAAGVSTQAVYARRLRHPAFARQWEAAVETGKVRLQMLLIAAAERCFDPDLLADEASAPEVSVGEAINILKTREGKERAGQSVSGRGWTGPDEDEGGEDEYDEACGRIVERLKRLGERTREERAAAGWSWCDEHQAMVPPGWVRG